MKRAQQACLICIALLASLCPGCDEIVEEHVEASVFYPDGYYREAKVFDDVHVQCKLPFACRSSTAIKHCKQVKGTWQQGKGYCGASATCGRCLYPDYKVADIGPDPDLPPPLDLPPPIKDKGAPDVSLEAAPQDAVAADSGAPADQAPKQ